MREIKFRKYDKLNKEWKYYDLSDIGYQGDYYWDDESVGQYTGLKDKNGKEIYDGDILKAQGIVAWNDVGHRWSAIDLNVECIIQ